MEKTLIANPIEMDLDDVVEEFNQQEKRLERAEKLLEEKDEELEIERQKAEAERQKAEATTRDKEAIIRNLAKMGLSIEDIAKAANTTVEVVKVILQ